MFGAETVVLHAEQAMTPWHVLSLMPTSVVSYSCIALPRNDSAGCSP